MNARHFYLIIKLSKLPIHFLSTVLSINQLIIIQTLSVLLRIGNLGTDYFAQNRGLKPGCNSSPSLFKMYIDELAKSLEQSDRQSGRDRARKPERKRAEHTWAPALFSCCKHPSKTDRFHLAHQADASGDCSVSLSLFACLTPSPSFIFSLTLSPFPSLLIVLIS